MDLRNLLCWISSASVRAFRCVCRVETNNKLWNGVAARSASTVDGGAKVFLEGRRGVGGGCGRVSWSGGAVSGADAAALHRGGRRVGSGYPITQSAIHYLTPDFFGPAHWIFTPDFKFRVLDQWVDPMKSASLAAPQKIGQARSQADRRRAARARSTRSRRPRPRGARPAATAQPTGD